ncbi:cytokine receptor-like factor 2 isoform X2 [Labeo rohita]|uniref:cytokine receptor-like factor 2 isoform X2 n=1 Tax=Labeo rohita TaxID=84645 RepID=UPI0021E26EAD|nr:cytokine receptor-like factor 2 isoform X2 [Labeo rohita]
MFSWNVYHLVALALLSAPESSAESDDNDDYDTDLDQIVFKISNTSHSITVTWWTPIDINPECCEVEVQYKSQCVKEWKEDQRIVVKQEHEVYHLNLSTISMKMNYDFRIRMKLWCLDKEWNNWTKVQSWGNNAGACMVEASPYIWVYILIIALPLTAFLLVFLLTQEGRLILPEVPDPKHFINKIMDTEQSQWRGNLTQWNEECSTTDIEIIEKNEREEQHQTLVIQPMNTSPESTYCIYSSETPGKNTEPQYSQNVLGYISL